MCMMSCFTVGGVQKIFRFLSVRWKIDCCFTSINTVNFVVPNIRRANLGRPDLTNAAFVYPERLCLYRKKKNVPRISYLFHN